MPTNLFYGTGIPACIQVLDKEHAGARKGVFMIDASKGFIKDGNKNRLRAQDIHRIVDAFTKGLEIAKYSRLEPVAEIEANDYNLNIPRYIDSTEPEDIQDIDAHLQGGILNRDVDALGRYWLVCPGLRVALFAPADRPGYSQLLAAAGDIKATIFGHGEFRAFKQAVTARFERWQTANLLILTGIAMGDKPKVLMETLSEDLLDTFRVAPLLEALIVERREQALKYEEYLAKIVELAKQVQNPTAGGAYPGALNTGAKRALYDNLDRDEALALAVDRAVQESRQDEWRSNPFKVKRVKIAIKAVLQDDEARTGQILELVKNQQDY